MNLFDILGPVMVGPSSSHTAGAVRIGWMTQKLLGEQPVEAKILMYGSFAATGKGHGTDGDPVWNDNRTEITGKERVNRST